MGPHKPLAFHGFWPYTSQEARYTRQADRAEEERKELKLKGGNLTSNLVDIHYHAQQAETNITKFLACLAKNKRPTDDTDAEDEEEFEISMDHFLVIDNEGKEPKVLLDFATGDSPGSEDIHGTLLAAAEGIVQRFGLLDKEVGDFDEKVFLFCYYFLKKCAPPEHDVLRRAIEVKKKKALKIPKTPEEVLPMLVAFDEEVFYTRYGKQSTATRTTTYDAAIHSSAQEALRQLPDLDELKAQVSILRKYTCLAVMQFIKDEGDWKDELLSVVSSVKTIRSLKGCSD